MDYLSIEEYEKFTKERKRKWIKFLIIYIVVGIILSAILITITINDPTNPAALGLIPIWFIFIVLLYLPLKYKNILTIIEHFKKANLTDAKCYSDVIVLKRNEIFFLGLPDRVALYLVKMLERMPFSKRKIKLPWNYYFAKPIKFGSGNIFFKKSKVIIRDENGEYIEGNACVLILPFEYVKRFLFFYSTIPGREYTTKEINEAVKILKEKCKEAIGLL